jgi:hypothetical protein
MSLIQDALKRKTEEHPPLSLAPQPAAPLKPDAPPPAQKTPPDSSAKKLFIILSLLIALILLLIGAGIFISTSRSVVRFDTVEIQTAAPPGPPAPAPSIAPPPVPAPKPVEAPATTKKTNWPDLSYAGSAVGGSQVLAIINGRMLSVGDRISGAEVLQIGKTEVLVEYKGEKRILRVDDE